MEGFEVHESMKLVKKVPLVMDSKSIWNYYLIYFDGSENPLNI